MKSSTIFYLLFSMALATISINAQPPFTHIKGLHHITAPEYPHLSIINGFVWWNKGIIENMYRLGDTNHSTIKLLWNLFHLQHDDVTFDITNIEKNPAKYFSIQTIGKILATVEMYSYQKTLSEEDKLKLFDHLFKTIANDINIDELTKKSEISIKKIKVKAKREFPAYKKYFEITEKNNAINRKKKLLKTGNQTKSEKTTIYANITTLKNEIKALGSKSKLSKDPHVKSILKKIHAATISKKSLSNTVNILIEAFDENLQKKYTPFSFHHILLAFVWQKANSRKDLIPFFEQLKLSYPEIINETALEALKTEQTPSQYTKKDTEEFNKSIQNAQITPNFIDENYEKIAFSLYSYDFYNNPMPPIIKSISNAIFQDQKGKLYSFPDCGSTSLRNFINIILYNFNKKICDISKLIQLSNIDDSSEKKSKTIPLIISPQLSNYYHVAKHKDVNYIQDRLAHSSWAQVTSDLANVEYLTPKKNGLCEIGLGISNMLKVINHLFFNNSSAFDQLKNSEKLDLLTSKVSNNNFKLMWKSDADVNLNIYDKNIVIKFIIELNENTSTLEFDWHFERKHFFIIVKKRDTTENKLKEKFHKPLFKIISNTNIMAMSSSVNNSKLVSGAKPKYSFLYFCSLNKQEIKILIQVDKILPQLEELYTYKGYLEFLAKQFGNLSPRISKKFIEHIIKEKITKHYDLALNYPMGTIPKLKETLFNNILQSRIKKYYNHVEIFLRHTFFKEQQTIIVKQIFSRNILELIASAKTFISINLAKITTQQEMKVELIKIIITHKLSSLYEPIKKEFLKLNIRNQKIIANLIKENETKSLYDLKVKEPYEGNENIGFFESKPKASRKNSPFRPLRQQRRLRRNPLRQINQQRRSPLGLRSQLRTTGP